MLTELGEGLVFVGAFVLFLYPLVLVLAVDILILMAILKGGGGNSSASFLTFFLFRICFNTGSRDSGFSYAAMLILCPFNAGLAIFISLYLGMPSLALILGLIPAVALGLIGLGALCQYCAETGIQEKAAALFEALKQQEVALALVIFLLLASTLAPSLLFYYSLPLYAYGVGFTAMAGFALLVIYCFVSSVSPGDSEAPETTVVRRASAELGEFSSKKFVAPPAVPSDHSRNFLGDPPPYSSLSPANAASHGALKVRGE